MRVTIPSEHATVLRNNVSNGVRLIERKRNQFRTYVVAYQGIALHFGQSRKSMQKAFNRYIAHGDDVRTMQA